MAGYVDFAQVKERTKITDLIPLLGLQMKQHGPQYRGPCPACRSGGDRALAINGDRAGWYCFALGKGGDCIALTAHIRGMTQKDAAAWIAEQTGTAAPASSVAPKRAEPRQERKPDFDAEAYAERLDASHASLETLGVTPDTLKAFRAGYAASGILRGRLALPLHDRQGKCVGYFGRTVKDESPPLIFPNNVNPHDFIFNAHQIKEGELSLVRDPLQVLTAYEAGMENCVAFLCPITAQMLEQLSSLMDEKKCEHVEIF